MLDALHTMVKKLEKKRDDSVLVLFNILTKRNFIFESIYCKKTAHAVMTHEDEKENRNLTLFADSFLDSLKCQTVNSKDDFFVVSNLFAVKHFRNFASFMNTYIFLLWDVEY